MVGADGVHSLVREFLNGKEEPIHRGRVAYRAVFPSALLGGTDLGPSRTKWWGTDRHIVIYYTTASRDEVYFVTSVPEPVEWLTEESWSATGDVDELRSAFRGFHPEVRAVLEACPACHKWAILEREPLPRWSRWPRRPAGRRVSPDDAVHGSGRSHGNRRRRRPGPLPRSLPDSRAHSAYEQHRKPRTSRIQAISSANTWLRTPDADPDWLYGYDAFTAPL